MAQFGWIGEAMVSIVWLKQMCAWAQRPGFGVVAVVGRGRDHLAGTLHVHIMLKEDLRMVLSPGVSVSRALPSHLSKR